jgi:hypothetical protein
MWRASGGLLPVGGRHLSASRNDPGRHHRIGGRALGVGAWAISPNRAAIRGRDVRDEESGLVILDSRRRNYPDWFNGILSRGRGNMALPLT